MMSLTKKGYIANIVANTIIVLLMITAIIMMFNINVAALSEANKWANFKYFTVLSNVYMGIASAISLFYLIFKKYNYPNWLITLKLSGTVSVFITFITTMLYLAPLMGFWPVMQGANFIMHLVLPLSALFTYIFFEPKLKTPLWHFIFGMAPVSIYGIIYLINVAVKNDFGNVNGADWYLFGAYGIGPGIGVLAGLIIASFGFTILFKFLHKKIIIKPLFNEKTEQE